MLAKDINVIDMLFKHPASLWILGLCVVLFIFLFWISPKNGTGPG